METFWNKQPGDAVWWPKRYDQLKPFFGVYELRGEWILYLGTPVNERIPIAKVDNINEPPLEYAEQLWGLYGGNGGGDRCVLNGTY